MRAPILTFIFIVSEYSIITGGDGNCGDPPKIENAMKVENITSKFRMNCNNKYVRQAGTSNLFKCVDKKWINTPPLVCMRNPLLPDETTQIHTSSPVTSSWSIITTMTHYKTTQPGKSTSPVTGKIVSTTTHTATTTPRTSRQTSQRTTTMGETTETTSITPRITVSSTTDKENLNTVCSHSPSSLSSTSTGAPGNLYSFNSETTKGITAGVVILVIIAGLAATVAALFWHQRSRQHGAGGISVEMKTSDPGTDHPLINTQTISSSFPPGSIQPPVTLFKDSPETTYIDATYSA